MVDLVSIAEAAKRLTAAGDKIDRSGLSHYLKRHAAALPTTKQSGRLTLVDYDALTGHRRAHLGKDLIVKGLASSSLSLADEQQGKLRADRLLAFDRLAKRKVDLILILVAERITAFATVAMRAALEGAAADTAALIVAERGGDAGVIRAVLLDHGRHAGDAMETALKTAGFLNMTEARLQELIALAPGQREPRAQAQPALNASP